MQSPTSYRDIERRESFSDPLSLLALQNEEESKLKKKTEITTTTTITTTTVVEEKLSTADGKEESQGMVGRWQQVKNSIKYSLVSKQTEGALWDIVEVFREMLKDLPFKPVDITVALLLIANNHRGVKINTDLTVESLETVSELHHFSKFASAAYGWKLIYGYGFKKKAAGLLEGFRRADANTRVLLEHTGVAMEDILQERWTTNNTFSPGHFVALDHSSKSLVVAIRGTFHVRDAFTDLVARYEPYKGGWAHGGILKAAREKYEELTPLILENLKKYPEYKLILVGHSLGAGTAALLATMWFDEYNVDMHCYAFAPPCILSLDLAVKCKSFVTSVCVNDDIIPRLCFGSMEDFKKLVQHVLLQKESTLTQKLYHLLNAGGKLPKALINKTMESAPLPDLGMDKIVFSERLAPPGKVYYVYGDPLRGGKYDTIEETAPSLFHDIILSSTMFVDHMPDLYEDSLLNCLLRLKENKNKVKTKSQETKEEKATVEVTKKMKVTKEIEVTKEKETIKEVDKVIIKETEITKEVQVRVEEGIVEEKEVSGVFK